MAPVPTWNPRGNSVHRLIQLLDVLAIAFNRYRQRSFKLPQYIATPEDVWSDGRSIKFDTPAYQAGRAILDHEFDQIRLAIFPPEMFPAPGYHAKQLALDAKAELAAAGLKDDAALSAVDEAAEWLENIGSGGPTPRPAIYGLLKYREANEQFEREGHWLLRYRPARTKLLECLALVGQKVSDEIHQRANLAFAKWQSDEVPITQVELLNMAWQVTSSDSQLLDAAAKAEQAKINELTRQFWIELFGMPAELSYEQGKAWAQERQSQIDSADNAWRNKVADFDRLIESRQRDRMLAIGFRDDEMHGNYVPCLPRYIDGNDPRMPAYKQALHDLELDQRALMSTLETSTEPIDLNAIAHERSEALRRAQAESTKEAEPVKAEREFDQARFRTFDYVINADDGWQAWEDCFARFVAATRATCRETNLPVALAYLGERDDHAELWAAGILQKAFTGHQRGEIAQLLRKAHTELQMLDNVRSALERATIAIKTGMRPSEPNDRIAAGQRDGANRDEGSAGSGAPAQSASAETTNGTSAMNPEPVLGVRALSALTAMLRKKAFDSDHRIRTADIARNASNGDANQYKAVIVELKKHGYVETSEGRGAGCWLTVAGRTRAEKL